MITERDIEFEMTRRSLRKSTARKPKTRSVRYWNTPEEYGMNLWKQVWIDPEWPLINEDTVEKFVKRYRNDVQIICHEHPRFDFGRDDVRFNHSGD